MLECKCSALTVIPDELQNKSLNTSITSLNPGAKLSGYSNELVPPNLGILHSSTTSLSGSMAVTTQTFTFSLRTLSYGDLNLS